MRREAQLIFKDSVPILQETHHNTITETGQFTLFGEIMAVHYETHTKHVNTLCGQHAEFHNVL